MKILSSTLIILLVALTSCGDKPVFDKFEKVKNSVWTYDQKMVFPVQIDDASSLYDFKIVVRTTTEYEYNNMWVFLSTTTPDGQVSREPFEIKITYDDGSWVGKKSGTIVETSLHFNRRQLPEAGKYIFTIEQGITEEKLKNVLDLGFVVQKL